MASIRLDRVNKTFASKTAIDSVSLEVPDGEFLVLLGPSGCGKSTLLRMLAGLETVTAGEIHLDGRRVDQLPPSARDMAFVFQSYALYPHMTVQRNMAFPLIMRRFRWWFHLPVLGALAKRRIERSPEVQDLVQQTAQILALTDMLDRYPRTLSGGQRQRVALGRAMVRQPEVFLMDEPLSNLDAKLRTVMRAEITKLHQRVGGTFVYVTHDQIEAMTMGTRIALMRDGVVQQFGTPREIYTNPANTYVARFIGTPPMNLIHAQLDESGLAVGESVFPLPAHLGASGTAGRVGPVLLGVRPNAVSILPPQGEATQDGPTLAGPTLAGPTLAGQITLVEHAGAESLIAVRLDHAMAAHDEEGSPPGEIMVTVNGYTELRVGGAVRVGLTLSEATLFSPQTGERL